MKTPHSINLCWFFLVAIAVMMPGCESGIQFDHAQPEDLPPLLAIPVQFQGKWGDEDGYDYLITRKQVILVNHAEKVFPLDSLAEEGYFLKGDSLFRERNTELLEFTTVKNDRWEIQDTLPVHLGEPYFKEGLHLAFLHDGHYYHFAKLTSVSRVAAYDSLGHPLPFSTINPKDDFKLNHQENQFIGQVGDTATGRKYRRIGYLFLESGTQEFTHCDSTSVWIQNDSLYLHNWDLGSEYRINQDMVVKASGNYAFFNWPNSLIGGWYLHVVEKLGADQMRLLYVSPGPELRIMRNYFSVAYDSVNAEGDSLYHHYASAKPEELMLFLKDDSLAWDTLVRMP
jgi:hypothetical protein